MVRTSIIIPTHNRPALLRRAIESAQKAGNDVEVIVVDDASNDETPSMCRDLSDIVYIRLDQNAGPSRARNIGIERSSGEFLAFLDDDDIRLAGSIDKQAEILMQNKDLGFVYGQVHIGDNENSIPTGQILPQLCPTGDIFPDLLRGNFIYTASILACKKSVENVGLFDPVLRGFEDWDMWMRLAEIYPIGALQEPVAIYRNFTANSGQASSDKIRMCTGRLRALNKALQRPRAQELDRRTRRDLRSRFLEEIWYTLLSGGRHALAAGRYRWAAANYATALWVHPKRALRPAAIVRAALGLMR